MTKDTNNNSKQVKKESPKPKTESFTPRTLPKETK